MYKKNTKNKTMINATRFHGIRRYNQSSKVLLGGVLLFFLLLVSGIAEAAEKVGDTNITTAIEADLLFPKFN